MTDDEPTRPADDAEARPAAGLFGLPNHVLLRAGIAVIGTIASAASGLWIVAGAFVIAGVMIVWAGLRWG